MTQYYQTLGIPQTATKEQIKKAYRKLSLKWHPDMPTGNKDKYIAIKEAYDALITFDPNTTHTQYQHKKTPFVRFNRTHICADGSGMIDISFKDVLFIQTIGAIRNRYHWDTYMYTEGLLKISKSDLIKCNYKVGLEAIYVNYMFDNWEITFKDNRTSFEKWRHNVMNSIDRFLNRLI